MRATHAVTHGCGLTKIACEKVCQQALGRCVEMTADQKMPTQCRLWATSMVHERPMCTMHASAVLIRQIEATRAAEKKAALDQRIALALSWHGSHPSVWDPQPRA